MIDLKNKTIGQRIKALRKEKHITQSSLADIVGLSKSTVAMWETDQRIPDIVTIKKLSNIFDTPMEWFVDKPYDNDSQNVVTMLGRNGTHKKFVLNDEQLQALTSLAETMCKKDD